MTPQDPSNWALATRLLPTPTFWRICRALCPRCRRVNLVVRQADVEVVTCPRCETACEFTSGYDGI